MFITNLARETEAGGDAAHCCGDQVVQVAVGRGGQLQSTETDIVKGFVVNAVRLISVFYELVNGQSGIVGFDDGIRHFGGRDDGEGVHNSVWVLFTDFGDEKRSQAGAGSATEGVGHLESLQTVASFGLLADDVQDGIHQFGTLGVMALGPVITSTALTWTTTQARPSIHMLAPSFGITSKFQFEDEFMETSKKSKWVKKLLQRQDGPTHNK